MGRAGLAAWNRRRLTGKDGRACAEGSGLMKKSIHLLSTLGLAGMILGLASCHTAPKPAPPQAAAEAQDHGKPKAKPGTP